MRSYKLTKRWTHDPTHHIQAVPLISAYKLSGFQRVCLRDVALLLFPERRFIRCLDLKQRRVNPESEAVPATCHKEDG